MKTTVLNEQELNQRIQARAMEILKEGLMSVERIVESLIREHGLINIMNAISWYVTKKGIDKLGNDSEYQTEWGKIADEVNIVIRDISVLSDRIDGRRAEGRGSIFSKYPSTTEDYI